MFGAVFILSLQVGWFVRRILFIAAGGAGLLTKYLSVAELCTCIHPDTPSLTLQYDISLCYQLDCSSRASQWWTCCSSCGGKPFFCVTGGCWCADPNCCFHQACNALSAGVLDCVLQGGAGYDTHEVGSNKQNHFPDPACSSARYSHLACFIDRMA